MYVHSQPLRIGTVELVNDTDSQSENKPARRSLSEPKETKIKSAVTLCGYRARFEACFVDLYRMPWETQFSTVLLKTSRKHQDIACFLSILIRLLYLGPFPNWLLSSHRSVEQFQCCISCTCDKTSNWV